MQTADFDVGELLDEATMAVQSAKLDAARTALLIGKLRTCAAHVNDGSRQKLKDVADQLERRMLET